MRKYFFSTQSFEPLIDFLTTELLYAENGKRLDLVVDDTSNIVAGIAAETSFDLQSVHTNHRLVKVTKQAAGYDCYFENGTVIQSKMVVLTVPISQLQKRKIDIDFISESKWNKIDRMPWAHFSNVFVLVESGTLPDRTFYLPTSVENPFRSVRRIDDFPGKRMGT